MFVCKKCVNYIWITYIRVQFMCNLHGMPIHGWVNICREHIECLSKIDRTYRTSIDIYRKSIGTLSNIYRKSIDYLSAIYRKSIEHPSNIYLKSIGNLSNIYRTSIDPPLNIYMYAVIHWYKSKNMYIHIYIHTCIHTYIHAYIHICNERDSNAKTQQTAQ